jgi:hypothetical protein
MFFVSRQQYWGVPAKEGTVVEIASGGSDYANPNMLVEKWRHLGEGKEFKDPREAVEAAINVAKAWRASGKKNVRIAYGSTGGFTMPFEPSTIKQAHAWAEKTYEKMPKCDQCGGVLPSNKRSRYKSWETGAEFCSERCAERAAEWDEEESRRIQEEMDAEGGGGARARRRPGAHMAHKRSGGGATASASARRLGLKNYYTLTIPWEPDPKKRTEWHPTDRTGPFKTLQRGAFPTTAAAHAWAKKHLGPGATYSIHRH